MESRPCLCKGSCITFLCRIKIYANSNQSDQDSCHTIYLFILGIYSLLSQVIRLSTSGGEAGEYHSFVLGIWKGLHGFNVCCRSELGPLGRKWPPPQFSHHPSILEPHLGSLAEPNLNPALPLCAHGFFIDCLQQCTIIVFLPFCIFFRQIHLTLPKVSFESIYNFQELLVKLGLSQLLGEKGNLKLNNTNLVVGKVQSIFCTKHKAYTHTYILQ